MVPPRTSSRGRSGRRATKGATGKPDAPPGASLRRLQGSQSELRRVPFRSLVDIMIENAVEGCVRETYGAVVAQHQALTAKDAEVRKVMTAVAGDETEHALLSWELAKWANARLGARERARVTRARAKAVREMAKTLSADVPAELVTVAGMPDAIAAQRIVASLSASALELRLPREGARGHVLFS